MTARALALRAELEDDLRESGMVDPVFVRRVAAVATETVRRVVPGALAPLCDTCGREKHDFRLPSETEPHWSCVRCASVRP